MHESLPWLSLIFLGAFHGLNPGMGWLFAVALGLQAGRRTAVLGALGPIAAGHLASIAVVVVLVSVARLVVPLAMLQYAAAAVLVAFGLVKLTRFGGHPRWVGMRVAPHELAAWSFLMATAHGAGLMLAPVILRLSGDDAGKGAAGVAQAAAPAAHGGHAEHLAALAASPGMPSSAIPLTDLLAVGLHSAAMLAVMGAVAVLVFDLVGLAVLRRAWINLDRVWAGSLVAVGLLTLVL
jgi:hypothetical protein